MTTPYTFSIYSNGALVENVYGAKGTATRGAARNLAEALSFAQMAADAAWRSPALSVMIWRNGRVVNTPSSFDLRALTFARRAS
jgi:hypothetical protein